MASPPKPSGDSGDKDAAVAKTAGFVAFSGIAMSIIKALTPQPCNHQSPSPSSPPPPPPPPPMTPPTTTTTTIQPTSEKKPTMDGGSGSRTRTVEIVRGDTLWGLSRKYGVSIDAIREANGIKGDRIYAGKKLIIP